MRAQLFLSFHVVSYVFFNHVILIASYPIMIFDIMESSPLSKLRGKINKEQFEPNPFLCGPILPYYYIDF